MTGHTTRRYNGGEGLSRVQRRRRWTPVDKVRIVKDTYLAGMSVSLVDCRYGICAGQLFTWRSIEGWSRLPRFQRHPFCRLSFERGSPTCAARWKILLYAGRLRRSCRGLSRA
ncbi:transposase [Sphingomonas parapaucimobilis]|uniref:transposase n=1 Tax=Sphingomonas parapaucimobilis TaxID=28213 RepID=UPI0039EC7482